MNNRIHVHEHDHVTILRYLFEARGKKNMRDYEADFIESQSVIKLLLEIS
jgi:hypothetical protein